MSIFETTGVVDSLTFISNFLLLVVDDLKWLAITPNLTPGSPRNRTYQRRRQREAAATSPCAGAFTRNEEKCRRGNISTWRLMKYSPRYTLCGRAFIAGTGPQGCSVRERDWDEGKHSAVAHHHRHGRMEPVCGGRGQFRATRTRTPNSEAANPLGITQACHVATPHLYALP